MKIYFSGFANTERLYVTCKQVPCLNITYLVVTFFLYGDGGVSLNYGNFLSLQVERA